MTVGVNFRHPVVDPVAPLWAGSGLVSPVAVVVAEKVVVVVERVAVKVVVAVVEVVVLVVVAMRMAEVVIVVEAVIM